MGKRDTTNTTTETEEGARITEATAGVGSVETPYSEGLRITNPQARDTLEGKPPVDEKPIEPGEPETSGR